MIIIGIPTYDGKLSQHTFTALISASKMPGVVGGFHIESSSLLCWNLNKILAKALSGDREKITHLCILHTDIQIETAWADKMLAIMAEKKADILSVSIPLKNDTGDTSTALLLDDPSDYPAWKVNRLSMKEIAGRGGTFTGDDLLVNTGVMLIDLRGEWIGGMSFEMEDCIIEGKDGKLQARVFPEDWNFSKKARTRGASIWVTNQIKAWHHGGGRWSNQTLEVK